MIAAGPILARPSAEQRSSVDRFMKSITDRPDENRARHGRTKAERQADDRQAVRTTRHLDAHRRERPDGED